MKMRPFRSLLLVAGCDCRRCDCPHEDEPSTVGDVAEVAPPPEPPPADIVPEPPIEPAPPKEPILKDLFGVAGAAVAVDSKGRIVVAGSGGIGESMAVWRFTPTGDLDASFGQAGLFSHLDPNWEASDARDVAVGSEGTVVVVGMMRLPGGFSRMVVWRLLDDGSLDPSFGDGGFRVYGTPAEAANPEDWSDGIAVRLDGEGRILVVGYARYMMALWRIKSSGDPDLEFGDAGITYYLPPLGPTLGDVLVSDVGTDPQGRIVVVGAATHMAYSTGHDLVVWRYLDSGELDKDFDEDGVVTYDAGGASNHPSNEFASALAIDPTGRILITGISGDSGLNHRKIVTVFFESSGTLHGVAEYDGVDDGTEGGGGEQGSGIVIDGKGGILVVGSARKEGMPGTQMILLRYESFGKLDETFGEKGVLWLGQGGGAAIALGPDGQIVAIGSRLWIGRP